MNASLQRCKLLITVVNHGVARKVVRASKEAGAEGGTTILGKGTGSHEIVKIFGIPVEPEKEIILTLVTEEKLDGVLKAVVSTAKLDKPGHGIAFVLDIKQIADICHRCMPGVIADTGPGGTGMADSNAVAYDLIVTIVNKGDAEKVVNSSRKAGAEGGTIMFGRGTGIHEHAKLFGITIEPEKEIVLTLIDRQHTNAVLEAIADEIKLNKPGKGIAFILAVDRVAGINHALNRMVKEKLAGNQQQ